MPTSTGEFSLKQWKEVQVFFENGDIRLEDIEPSALRYDQVQANRIDETIQNEKIAIKETDKQIRGKAYDESKPTLEQGIKVAALAGLVEGGTAFAAAVYKKRKAGKRIGEFDSEDWKEIFKESGVGTIKGTVRGAGIYVLTNYTATPAAVASSICTASFGIAEQAYLLRTGKITEDQFLMNSEMLCLETAVSALSSFVGQAVIPIPILGAVIGNTVGTLLYQIAKDNLSKREQRLIRGYLKYLAELDRSLDKKYRKYIDELNKELCAYYSILERAFSPNYEEAFQGSIALAVYCGVPRSEILMTMAEVDDYFLN